MKVLKLKQQENILNEWWDNVFLKEDHPDIIDSIEKIKSSNSDKVILGLYVEISKNKNPLVEYYFLDVFDVTNQIMKLVPDKSKIDNIVKDIYSGEGMFSKILKYNSINDYRSIYLTKIDNLIY